MDNNSQQADNNDFNPTQERRSKASLIGAALLQAAKAGVSNIKRPKTVKDWLLLPLRIPYDVMHHVSRPAGFVLGKMHVGGLAATMVGIVLGSLAIYTTFVALSAGALYMAGGAATLGLINLTAAATHCVVAAATFGVASGISRGAGVRGLFLYKRGTSAAHQPQEPTGITPGSDYQPGQGNNMDRSSSAAFNSAAPRQPSQAPTLGRDYTNLYKNNGGPGL